MAPIWDQMGASGMNTVIGAASWELVEPSEGRSDFTAGNDQIRQARVHGLRPVMIRFGPYKNAAFTYVPSWGRRDEARFPRAIRDPAIPPTGLARPHVSLFGEALVKADALALAALMAHLRETDR